MNVHTLLCVCIYIHTQILQRPKTKPLKNQTEDALLQLVISNIAIHLRYKHSVSTKSICLHRCFNDIICKL